MKTSLLLILTSIVLIGCKKNQPPKATISSIEKVTSQSAIVHVTMTNKSNVQILERGVYFSLIPGDTLLDNLYTHQINWDLIDPQNESFTTILKNLPPSSTLYINCVIKGSYGFIGFAKEMVINTPPSETTPISQYNSYSSVADIEGNVYKTINIGGETWMAENLRVSKFNDGTDIPEEQNSGFYNLNYPLYTYLNNDQSTNSSVGKLYNYHVIVNGNICPQGWHLPTYTEVINLITNDLNEFIPSDDFKSTGYNYWSEPNLNATNYNGFSAIPGGIQFTYAYTNNALYWLELDNSSGNFKLLSIGSELTAIINELYPEKASPIRCVKD